MRGHIARKGKRYYVVVDVGIDPETGRRRRKWHSGFKTKREAEQALAKIVTELGSGAYVEPSKLALGEYLRNEWLPATRSTIRPSTWESYRQKIEVHIIPALGTVQLRALTPGRLNAFYARLHREGRHDGEGLSVRSVRYVHAVLRKALADAVKWGRIPRNPSVLADPPRQRRRQEMRTWSAEQLRAFLDHVKETRLSALWRLLGSTGMRRGEALGLKWEDLDFEASTVAIRRALIEVKGLAVWSDPKTARGRRLISLDVTTMSSLRRIGLVKPRNGSPLAPHTPMPAWSSVNQTGRFFTRPGRRNCSGSTDQRPLCQPSASMTSDTRTRRSRSWPACTRRS